MSRTAKQIPRLSSVRGDYEDAIQNYMLKAGVLSIAVMTALDLDQLKTPSAAEALRKALAKFEAA